MTFFLALSFVLASGGLPGFLSGSSADLDFAHKFLVSTLAASEFNRIAVERSANDELRKFAQSRVDSAVMTSDWIRQILRRKGIAAVPGRTGENDAINALSVFTGTDFDRSYFETESASQREQVNLCEREIANGADADLKRLAVVSLDRLRRQARLLAELASNSGSQVMCE